jgi:hypothetical protein
MIERVAPRDPVLARQLYKTTVALGCYFLAAGEQDDTDAVRAALRGVSNHEIALIHTELQAVSEPEFWEVTERWVNFDYLDTESRRVLPEFIDSLIAVRN